MLERLQAGFVLCLSAISTCLHLMRFSLGMIAVANQWRTVEIAQPKALDRRAAEELTVVRAFY